MAGKKYELPRPGLDPVPFLAGADGVGYEKGFKPPARYSRAGTAGAWKQPAPSVTAELHCNIRPRTSLAPALDAASARRLGVGPYLPGRVPAPRFEGSCGHLIEITEQPSGAYARDLIIRPTQKSKGDDEPQFPGGPQPNPPGLDPMPPPIPPADTPEPPAPPPIAQPPTTPPTSPPSSPAPPPISTRVPGSLQAINFHLTGDIAAGAAASEIRVAGPVGVPFIIRELWINTDSGAAPGQFLDVLISGDGDTTDTATPTGESIFPLLNGLAAIPAPDAERGLSIPANFLGIKLAYRVDSSDRWIKVRQYFIAPALALANIHVTVIIERMDAPGMSPPPIQPRPPIIDPEGPAPTPPSAPQPPLSPAPAPFYVDPNERGFTAPAWRVAAQGLARTTQNLQRGLSHQIDALSAWLHAPNSATAAPFRNRIDMVLQKAGIEDGNHNTYVSLSYTLDPWAK
jgi:hypothetical protein